MGNDSLRSLAFLRSEVSALVSLGTSKIFLKF